MSVVRAGFLIAVGFVTLLLGACGGGEDLGGPKLGTDAAELGATAAEAMGNVRSVQFMLERTGAAVYIDGQESMSLDLLEGRFSAPGSAEAILDVTVNESLRTKLGAVAIGEEIWLSNPVTGEFETLPLGFDIDPSLFFDPENGWRPLIAGLTDLTFIGEEDRDGTRYHLTGTAQAADMSKITAGLVRGQDVDVDMWLHPVTGLVTDLAFDTEFDGDVSSWQLRLENYGDTFTITDPTLE